MAAGEMPGAQELLDRMEAECAPAAPDESRFYGWQPLPLLDFYRGMRVAGEGSGRRFLDVGSGIGSKLALAAALGWDPSGIELRPAYVEVSQRLFPVFPVRQVDAFAFDGYAQFDLVYCYRPCVDPAEQETLNRLIAGQLRPGALFFSAGGPYPAWLDEVGEQVWRTPS